VGGSASWMLEHTAVQALCMPAGVGGLCEGCSSTPQLFQQWPLHSTLTVGMQLWLSPSLGQLGRVSLPPG